MPVTTRAAASKAKGNEVSTDLQQGKTSNTKKPRQNRSQQKQKEVETQSTIVAAEPQVVLAQQPGSTSSRVEPTSSSPISKQSTVPFSPNESVVQFESPNDINNEILLLDANDLTNVPVVKGEITTGKSTRGGKMIFMSGFSYLYMSEGKVTTGWRCARRDLRCKAVIHINKDNEFFSHWNGIGHCHSASISETRKREILNKIKFRVLDDYIPIKIIVEDEYRKANLSEQEKQVMPLPSQIGIQTFSFV